MRKVNLFTLMLAVTPGLFAVPVYAEDIFVAGDIGVVSQYVARGGTYTSGKPAVQGDIVVGYGGLSASVWFSNAYPSPAPQYAGRDTVEFDWGLDYSGAIDALGYSVGVAYYTFLYDSASNAPEAYVGLSYEAVISPSIKTYVVFSESHNKAYLVGDIWTDFSLATDIAGLTFSAGCSYAYWVKDAVNRPNTDIYKDGLTVATLGVSKDIEMGDVTLTASLSGSVPIIADSADGNKYIYGAVAKNEVMFGLNLAF